MQWVPRLGHVTQFFGVQALKFVYVMEGVCNGTRILFDPTACQNSNCILVY